MILLILASQEASITGMSHMFLARDFVLERGQYWGLNSGLHLEPLHQPFL
jgi:hypothetical protein